MRLVVLATGLASKRYSLKLPGSGCQVLCACKCMRLSPTINLSWPAARRWWLERRWRDRHF